MNNFASISLTRLLHDALGQSRHLAKSELARLEFWRGMIGKGFWEAYQAHARLSDSYPRRRPMYQLLWCLEYARPTPQHLRDTASVCKALHLAPVTFP